MKRAILLCVAITGLAMLAGCVYDREASCPQGTNNNGVDFPSGAVQPDGSAQACEDESGQGCQGRRGLGRRGGEAGGDGGEAVGGVAYPYYTIRGPRDFLQRTPTPIGP
jgi:hypothetical protein